jgi:hypothetical protein
MRTCLLTFLLVTATAFSAEPPESATNEADRAEWRRGCAAAARDIAQHIVKYEIVGFPAPDSADLKREAMTRFGVDVVFRGCVPGPNVWYDRGYLDTVIQHLSTKHGQDPIAQLHQELMKKRSGPQ